MARINVRIEMSECVQTPGALDYSGLVKHARLPLNLEYFTKWTYSESPQFPISEKHV